MGDSPIYPLRVVFDDGDEWLLDDPIEVASSLEWFDSDNSSERAKATDSRGRGVRVRVVAHRLEVCELLDS